MARERQEVAARLRAMGLTQAEIDLGEQLAIVAGLTGGRARIAFAVEAKRHNDVHAVGEADEAFCDAMAAVKRRYSRR